MAAPFVYRGAISAHIANVTNWSKDLVSLDLRTILVMTNTVCDTEDTVALMNAWVGNGGGIGGMDEFDGATYVAFGHVHSETLLSATSDARALDLDDAVYTTVGVGTRNIQGAVLYNHVTDYTDSIPFAYYNFTAFPATGNTITIQWAATGAVNYVGAGA